MDPLSATHSFLFVFGVISFCFCCDRYVCKNCILKIKNNPWIFTPPSTPESNRPPPPTSPTPSDRSADYSPNALSPLPSPLPSPATMKPDYSSGEDYVDIYIEYCHNNRNIDTSPTNNLQGNPGTP